MTTPSGTAWVRRLREADAVLFDFDGTLAPNLDLPGLRRRVVDLTLACGVPEAAFAGRYIVEVLDAGAGWLRGGDAAAADSLLRDGHHLIREFELDAARATAPFPEARSTLAALRARGKSLAVVTRNCRAAVLTVFPDLEDYCHTLLARDDVVHLKPDERHLRQALDDLGRGTERAVMVSDGVVDIRLGKALGLCCVGVLTGSGDEPALRGAGADVVLSRAADLAGALGPGQG